MLRLKKALLIFVFLCPIWAQEEPLDPDPTEITNTQAYDDVLEGRLKDFSSESQKEVMDVLTPAQKQKLMDAISSGNQAKVESLMKEITLSATKNPEGMQKLIKYSLEQFRSKSFAQVRAELQSKVDGTLFEPVVNAAPKLLDFFTNLLRDPLALPEFFKIAANRTKLLIFLGINILLFIIKWLIKKKEKKKKAPFGERLSRFFFFFGLRLVLIGVFFHNELWPMVIVAKRTFS